MLQERRKKKNKRKSMKERKKKRKKKPILEKYTVGRKMSNVLVFLKRNTYYTK